MLNELAYMKYEASKNSSLKEDIILKQRNVATAFSLVEKIIKLISNIGEEQGELLMWCQLFARSWILFISIEIDSPDFKSLGE